MSTKKGRIVINQYIEIGKITSTHALKGEFKMVYWCDDPEFLLNIKSLFLDREGKEKVDIRNSRFHKNFLIIKISGVDHISQTSNYIGKTLYINRDEIILQEGEYLQCDLIGLEVIDVDTKIKYGKITKITQTGANDVYHIQGLYHSKVDCDGQVNDGELVHRELLIPAIKDVIKKVDLDNKIMLIKPLDGLFDI